MEFEFKRGFGEFSVRTSMGHEIIGRWLQEEVGRDLTKIEQVNALIAVAQQSFCEAHKLVGNEISLTIESGEVLVQENAMLFQSEHELEPDFELYDSESYAVCGLEDFEALIQQWLRFVTTGQ
ncbi:YacL family protein [Vibrio gallicus]|uniref:UPF0231 family protein n=1 Tax=Vibrio gallicus TaxID=190897 RepID=UPI0021C2F7CE|nr:YacL family protein [Vibrio gallicus]